MEELKACPFYGATAQVIEEVTGFPDELEYFVLCDDLECENRTGPQSTASAAIAAWNRRAAPENKPLTCDGCEHNGKYEDEYEYGYPSPCTGCKRRSVDYYARRPDKEDAL